jgi:hypothetical protein
MRFGRIVATRTLILAALSIDARVDGFTVNDEIRTHWLGLRNCKRLRGITSKASWRCQVTNPKRLDLVLAFPFFSYSYFVQMQFAEDRINKLIAGIKEDAAKRGDKVTEVDDMLIVSPAGSIDDPSYEFGDLTPAQRDWRAPGYLRTFIVTWRLTTNGPLLWDEVKASTRFEAMSKLNEEYDGDALDIDASEIVS